MRYQIPASTVHMSAGSLSSMIDIVFLLIIFFVVTASFDQEQIDHAVTLPAVDRAAIKSLPEKRLMINVLADGAVKVGFHHIEAASVATELDKVLKSLKTDPQVVLIINGDRNTPHKYISAVMNSAAKAGYHQVRINAEVKSEAK